MPRVTLLEYYRRHEELSKVWVDAFPYLDALEQWHLHEYYRPSEKLVKDELSAHWQELHATKSSLHQQAGRAYAKLQPHLDSALNQAQQLVQATSSKDRPVVFGLVNPTLDVKMMTEVMMMLGNQLIDEAKNSGKNDVVL